MNVERGDFSVAMRARVAIDEAVRDARDGRAVEVLTADHGDDRGYVYVVSLLEADPALGKVAARRLLDSLGIAHRIRVSDLDDTSRSALLAACGAGS